MPSADPAETLAAIRCVECARVREGNEVWRVYFLDVAEACLYCPDCAEREFGDDSGAIPPGSSG